jgi:hypothetical protein
LGKKIEPKCQNHQIAKQSMKFDTYMFTVVVKLPENDEGKERDDEEEEEEGIKEQ